MAASVSSRTGARVNSLSSAVGSVPLSISSSGAIKSNNTTTTTAPSQAASTSTSHSPVDPSKWTYKKLSNGHRSQVRCVAYSRSSVEYRGHTGDASLVRWNPVHPERFASCSATVASDKSLHFWDMREGNRPTHTIATEGENIQMVWSPDGKTIVVSSRRDIMTWIDVESQQIIKKWDVGKEVSPAAVTVLDLDPKGRYLAAGSTDATVTLWDTREWTCTASAGFHDEPPRVVRFCNDGQYLASSCGDKEVVVSRVPSLATVMTLPTGGPVDSVAWHPTKNVLAFSSSEDVGGVRLWGPGL
ncbi:hypothetical protein OIV83_002921 [Microbotryomycetes sp. JL201]|nr:hypothetical protein OIV83_002921 [Microbotryomycetes sp. JL201]